MLRSVRIFFKITIFFTAKGRHHWFGSFSYAKSVGILIMIRTYYVTYCVLEYNM